MKQFDLSNLITSMGKSFSDAVIEMKKSKIACDLEEFECTVTLQTEVDTAKIGIEENTKTVKGLRFYETRKIMLPKKEYIKQEGETPKGTLVLRAIFSPKTEE